MLDYPSGGKDPERIARATGTYCILSRPVAGWFRRPEQARDATDHVRQSASSVDTFVVIFVHGWHHSTECCDENVEGFNETLARLYEQLAHLQPPPTNFALVRIYVGWRARSLPGDLDYKSSSRPRARHCCSSPENDPTYRWPAPRHAAASPEKHEGENRAQVILPAAVATNITGSVGFGRCCSGRTVAPLVSRSSDCRSRVLMKCRTR